MKRISLPSVKFTRLVDGELEEITAAGQLYQLVAFPPPTKGLSIEDIRQRLPLCDKLDRANSTLLLEDAEHKLLLQTIDEASWRAVNKDVLTLADAVRDAETVKAEPNRAERRK